MSKADLDIITAKRIIRDTLWMARRYAHMRSSYATAMLNEAIDRALELGIDIQDDVEIGRYADDAMFGKWDPVSRTFRKTEESDPR